MHIHLPKPLHGWREFLGEIGVIVIGVTLALAAEQAIEAWHWADRIRDAKASMVRELGDDDGAQAQARIAISPCIDAMLDAVERRIIAERDGGAPLALSPLKAPVFRTWDSDAWRAAQSSQVTSRMSAEEMYNWSSPYSLISDMDQAQVREYGDWAPFVRIGAVAAHPSPEQRDRLLAAIANARRDNDLLTFLSRKFVDFSAVLGISASEDRRRKQIAEQASSLPGCHPRPDR